MKIEKVSNGYIVYENRGLGIRRHVFETLKEVFEYELLYFEGKSESFSGDLYAKIEIKNLINNKI